MDIMNDNTLCPNCSQPMYLQMDTVSDNEGIICPNCSEQIRVDSNEI